jgi:hypothetical protein
LQEQATLRTRVKKGGVTDWDAVTRGWQAKAAQKAGVDLASLYRRVSRLERSGRAPREAGPELTQDEITRASAPSRTQSPAATVRATRRYVTSGARSCKSSHPSGARS